MVIRFVWGTTNNCWNPSAIRNFHGARMTPPRFLFGRRDVAWHTLFTSSPFLPPPSCFSSNPRFSRSVPSSTNPSKKSLLLSMKCKRTFPPPPSPIYWQVVPGKQRLLRKSAAFVRRLSMRESTVTFPRNNDYSQCNILKHRLDR